MKRLQTLLLAACAVIILSAVVSCAGKEEKIGKVVVTEQAFELESDGNYSDSLNVRGKVKNVGSFDVKNVVVSGDCNSCSEAMISGQWFVTRLQTDEQKAVIPYLAPGAEEEFRFKDIAYFYHKSAEKPSNLPEGLDVYVKSFETVQE